MYRGPNIWKTEWQTKREKHEREESAYAWADVHKKCSTVNKGEVSAGKGRLDRQRNGERDGSQTSWINSTVAATTASAPVNRASCIQLILPAKREDGKRRGEGKGRREGGSGEEEAIILIITVDTFLHQKEVSVHIKHVVGLFAMTIIPLASD